MIRAKDVHAERLGHPTPLMFSKTGAARARARARPSSVRLIFARKARPLPSIRRASGGG